MTVEVGTGSAPDGDEDAILGMVLLVLGTRDDSLRPSWFDELAQWTYQSCKSFLLHLTTPHPTRTASNGAPLRALKLGSCWGGWDCSNPSYHSPGHWRAFRDYMLAYAATYGSDEGEGSRLALDWNALIETSYEIIGEGQCAATGLVTNWWVPSHTDATGHGTAGCSGSGTPADEFGSEAGRLAWRVAVDAVWYGTPEAIAFSHRLGGHAVSRLAYYRPGCTSPQACANLELSTGCDVASIHSDWVGNAFMLGPVATALQVPLSPSDPNAPQQQAALDTAAELIASQTGIAGIGYYSGSWIAIATTMMSGDMPRLAALVQSISDPVPPSPPRQPPLGPRPACPFPMRPHAAPRPDT